MKKYLPDESSEERLRIMQENADRIEETTYFRDLLPEELEKKREQFVDNSIKISQLEDELDTYKEKYKGQIKPIKSENVILQDEIKTRKAGVKGTLYHMANHPEGMMETYDENGDLITMRRLTPDEKRQTRVTFISKVSGE